MNNRVHPLSPFNHFSPTRQGSFAPFLPFFLAGSTSRGRVAGGGGGASSWVLTCGAAGSVFLGAAPGVVPPAGAVAVRLSPGAGGRVICSSFGSTPAGVAVLLSPASFETAVARLERSSACSCWRWR